jgi:hypothetical protein
VATTPVKRPAVREWTTAAVSWAPARNSIKRATHVAAYGRAGVLAGRRRMPTVMNLYSGSCPKSGSQWIKAVLDHPLVRAQTGLLTLPQLDYYGRPRNWRFPRGTYVPGLYLSYAAYRKIPKPADYRTVYIFRDPRDIVVSGYFSGLKTHRLMQGLEERRKALEQMTVEEGLLSALDYGQQHLRDMATWVDVSDPKVATWRLEDISADPETAVPAILTHCGVELPAADLRTVVAETSREALQRRDLSGRQPGTESHYRVERQTFRELFGPQHHEAVERVVPGLVERLGYPSP